MSTKEYCHVKELLKEVEERMNYLLEELEKEKYDPVQQEILAARYSENKVIHYKLKEVILDFQLGNGND